VRPYLEYATPILIVDDHDVMVQVMSRLIRKIGFKDVEHATDGNEALRMLRKKHYELVIADLNMGAFGGLHLLRAVRSDERLRNTRFLIVTADSRTGNVRVANKLGVDGYLLKPFTPAQLKARVGDALMNGSDRRDHPSNGRQVGV
jgi:two-component system, chemotaxis family, chemotaxis protein CheY